MSFVRVNQLSEIAPFVDDSFNPPTFTPDFTDEDFESEYASVHGSISDHLQHAEAAMSGLAEEAFSVGAPFSDDRVIVAVIHYIGLLSPELLRDFQRILTEAPQEYRVVLDGSDTDGRQFYIIITGENVIAYADNPKALAPLGVN